MSVEWWCVIAFAVGVFLHHVLLTLVENWWIIDIKVRELWNKRKH